MFQLMYASVTTIPVDQALVEDILSTSRRKNEQANITGLLLYKGGRWLQLLEGPEENVRAMFATIKADERHKDVTLIYEGEAESRTFSEWEMGFRDVEEINLEGHEGVSDFFEGEFSPQELATDEPRIQAYLQIFRGITE